MISVYKPEPELELRELEDGWTYAYDKNWTNIYTPNKQKVVVFYRKLEYSEVYLFKAGFDNGYIAGQNQGYAQKSEEIKKLLKL